jgi:uncharacterized protein (TIGR02270 family)
MPPVIPEVVSQHAEEAAFLWLLRDAAVHAPHYSLLDLARLDGRVEAHLDGLRVAGDAVWDMCRKALEEGDDAGEVFAAAVMAFESGDEARIQEVVATGTTSLERSRGLASALGWLEHEQAANYLHKFLGAESSALRRVALAGSAVHRRTPTRALEAALSEDEPFLRARALKAVGEQGSEQYHLAVRRSLKAEDEACRFWAAWSAAILVPDEDALAALRAIAESGSPFAERAVQIAARRMELHRVKTWQGKLAENPNQARLAVIAAGAVGDPEAVAWLIEQMKVLPLARVAGEAFSMITGVHISYDNLEAEKPEGFEAGPTENPEDENVAVDLDLDLYWPDARLVEKWWGDRRGGFAAGTRYLLGKPITIESLQDTLRTGKQRQREVAALELAMRQPGSVLYEVRAPGSRQQRELGTV